MNDIEKEGCQCCKSGEPLTGKEDVCLATIKGRLLKTRYSDSFYDWDVVINYCPICGRRITNNG